MGERAQKKNSEECQENNSLKKLTKNIYTKPSLKSGNDEVYKKVLTYKFSFKLQV